MVLHRIFQAKQFRAIYSHISLPVRLTDTVKTTVIENFA